MLAKANCFPYNSVQTIWPSQALQPVNGFYKLVQTAECSLLPGSRAQLYYHYILGMEQICRIAGSRWAQTFWAMRKAKTWPAYRLVIAGCKIGPTADKGKNHSLMIHSVLSIFIWIHNSTCSQGTEIWHQLIQCDRVLGSTNIRETKYFASQTKTWTDARQVSGGDTWAHLHDQGGVPDVHGELVCVPAQVRRASVWVNWAQHAKPVH